MYVSVLHLQRAPPYSNFLIKYFFGVVPKQAGYIKLRADKESHNAK